MGELTASGLSEVADPARPLGVVKRAELLAMRGLTVSHEPLMVADDVTRGVPTMVGPAAHMVVVPNAAQMRPPPPATKAAGGKVCTTKMGTTKAPATEVTTATTKAAMPSFGGRDGACDPEKDCTDRDYRPHEGSF
jgi:hypothetical protein